MCVPDHMLLLYTSSHLPVFSIWSSKRRKLNQRKVGCEGRWMSGWRDGDYTICFTTGSRDFLSISLEKNEMRASRRITWESHEMMPSLFWRASHVQEKCGPPLTYWQSWARPRLWQVTIFHLIFQGSVKKLSFLNLPGRLYHFFLCTPIAPYSYII